jgi:hypothetical protein
LCLPSLCCSRARHDKNLAEKKSDWEWQEKRAKERRARARRKHRRDRMHADAENEMMSRAMGRVDKQEESDSGGA